jgi:hypothetical protein
MWQHHKSGRKKKKEKEKEKEPSLVAVGVVWCLK